ncbi:hypothetical protein OsJ_35885 [Oryza sativa Japonica Group]|uniref:Uncharacterized protein n=1 Tax=Oryza sativa subsp. japonica TaxID=39947 RepID=A3CGR9_ORYSJ|nr:hypothetical protein OsJ_35885 [Oryza sativa Japonica Group]
MPPPDAALPLPSPSPSRRFSSPRRCDLEGREADRRSARDARHARSKGKRLVFVTNNSTKSRKQYGKKFETLGLNVNEEEIFASSFAYVAYLQSIDFPKDKKVYVIGEDGILKELELAGFQYLGGPSDGDKKIELKPGFYMEHDKDVTTIPTSTRHLFHMYRMVVGDSVSTASSINLLSKSMNLHQLDSSDIVLSLQLMKCAILQYELNGCFSGFEY